VFEFAWKRYTRLLSLSYFQLGQYGKQIIIFANLVNNYSRK
jgi:hypothetical protein